MTDTLSYQQRPRDHYTYDLINITEYFTCFAHNVAGAPPAAAATFARSSLKKFDVYPLSTNSLTIDILGNSPPAGTK